MFCSSTITVCLDTQLQTHARNTLLLDMKASNICSMHVYNDNTWIPALNKTQVFTSLPNKKMTSGEE